MAFLINAYNAFTVEKILTRYPDLKSIRDFGKVFGNPCKDKFFTLFGRPFAPGRRSSTRSLREQGVYDEPRVHFAVICASIGCPMLREEAYVAERLDAQLEEQTRRSSPTASRNRYNAQTGALEVSRIFDWYEEDSQSGHKGLDAKTLPITSREQYFARYAKLLADDPAQQKRSRTARRRRVPRVRLVPERREALSRARRG